MGSKIQFFKKKSSLGHPVKLFAPSLVDPQKHRNKNKLTTASFLKPKCLWTPCIIFYILNIYLNTYEISCRREKPDSCTPLGLIRVDDLSMTPLLPTRRLAIVDIISCTIIFTDSYLKT